MSSTYTDILAALDSRLNSVPGIPVIAWHNKPHKPVVGTPFVRPSLMLAQPMQAEIGTDGCNKQVGVYQISLFYPAGTGKADIMTAADLVCSWFKRGTRLTYNGITVTIERAHPEHFIEEKDWLHFPISTYFNSYTANT